MMLLWVMLRIKFGYLNELDILVSIFKISFSALIMGIVVQAMKYVIAPLVDMEKFWGILTQGLVAGLVGLAAFVLVCLFLRCDEMIVFIRAIKKKLFKTTELPETGIRESG